MLNGISDFLELLAGATPWAKFIHIIVFISPVVLLGSAYWLDKTEDKRHD